MLPKYLLKMRRWTIYLILFAILANLTYAQSGTIKLLAVSDTPNGLTGSMADLKLDIKKGEGRIFIDTLPASKIDTQITTRFARDMACRYLKTDCSHYDFFYTIVADSAIIGGPSAGAATTLLTISLLGGIKLDKDVALTGTINSGYLVGSVGGVKQKIEAASQAGMKKVLIPVTEVSFEEENKSIDYAEYGKQKNVTIIRVANMDDVLYEFTGKRFDKNGRNVEIDPSYKETMKGLASELCNRSKTIRERVLSKKTDRKDGLVLLDNKSIEMEGKAENLTAAGRYAYENGEYYSAASYCFGANVNYHYLLFRLSNASDKEIADVIETTDREIKNLNDYLDNYDIKTITDLQAFIVSKQRAVESTDYLNATIDSFKERKMDDMYMNLAFAIERVYSASSWSRFLGNKGKEFDLEKDQLRVSCSNKLNEAEEYFQYIQLLFPGLLNGIGGDLQRVEKDFADGNYGICLHKASLAKADVTIVLSTIGFKEENLQKLLDMKLNAAKKTIIEQQENGVFPIVGYSYYEYAKNLRNESIYSALLYSEYSLELSNLDIYFKPKIGLASVKTEEFSNVFIFLAGAFAGIIIFWLFSGPKKSGEEHARREILRKIPKRKQIKFDFGRRRKI